MRQEMELLMLLTWQRMRRQAVEPLLQRETMPWVMRLEDHQQQQSRQNVSEALVPATMYDVKYFDYLSTVI
jgi:hypothetical protein